MTRSDTPLRWLITGASSGFGRIFAETALAQGDRVVATARNVAAISDLPERYPQAALALPLDVTDPRRSVRRSPRPPPPATSTCWSTTPATA